MKKIPILAVIAATAGSLLFASQARANTESFTVDYGTEVSPLTSPDSVLYLLPKFDTALGTLTNVSLVLSSNDEVAGQIFNITGSNIPYTDAFATIPVTVSAVILDGLTATATGYATYGAGVALPGLNSLPSVTVTASDTAGLSSGFAPYEGVGGQTYDLTVTSTFGTYGGQADGSTPLLFFVGSAASYGDVEVTYTYTAVPDGGYTVLLLGIGFVGLAFFGFRQNRHQVGK
jgi:hypothetical protein